MYTSPHLPKPLHIRLPDTTGDNERRRFNHFLWNSSLLLAELIEADSLRAIGKSSSIQDSDVNTHVEVSPARGGDFSVVGLSSIELGAGAALPSLMAALWGARHVVVTDYPSEVVMETLRQNIVANIRPSLSPSKRIVAIDNGDGIHVEGHSWGRFDTPLATTYKHTFDRVFVADCLWASEQHDNLRKSIGWFMGTGATARAWLVAGFHTGRETICKFLNADELADEGLEVERIWEQDCNGVDREWRMNGGLHDITELKRWLVVAVLKRVLMR